MSGEFTNGLLARSDVQNVGFATITSGLFQQDLRREVAGFNSDRPVRTDEGVVFRAAVSAERRVSSHLAAIILLRWIHPPITFPGLRIVRDVGKLVFDGVQNCRKQVQGVLRRCGALRGPQSPQENLKPFLLRQHGKTLGKAVAKGQSQRG